MGWKTYGQDNALLWQWKSIGKHTDDLNRSDSLDALRSAEGKSELSLRDLYFQNAFMLFYLEPFLATKGRNDRKMGSRTPEFYTSIPESSWKQWRAKTTVDYEGKKISTFGDWLALID